MTRGLTPSEDPIGREGRARIATSDARWREFDQVPGRSITPVVTPDGVQDKQVADSTRVREITARARRYCVLEPDAIDAFENEGGSIRD